MNPRCSLNRSIQYGVACCCSAVVWLGSVSGLWAQEPQEPVKFPPNARYVGIENCSRCHSKPEPGKYATDFVLLNESSVWEQHDKHSQAFRLLVGVTTDENGTRINTRALGLVMLKRLTGNVLEDQFAQLEEIARDTNPEFLKAAKSPVDVRQVTKPYLDAAARLFLDDRSSVGFGCLTCHANMQKKETYQNADLEKSFRATEIVNAVSCEACHGPSDLWEGPHRDRVVERKHLLAAELPATPENGLEKNWRELTPEQKMKFGFIEVRNPAVRAQQCFNCHIGNKAEGKFIPHQWYVAGHPPLPNIELSTFANDMPRHWRHLPEKGQFEKREAFLAANDLEAEALQDAPETKAALVGGLVSLRMSLELLASVSAEQTVVPNFAGYDCLSCHQELRNEPVVNRDRFDPTLPGRPGLPRWSTALVETSLLQLDPSGADLKTFRTDFDLLRDALGKRPFGDKKSLQAAAAKITPWLRDREHSLAKLTLTPEHLKLVQTELLTAATKEDCDFHTARQIAWALRRVEIELASPVSDLANQAGNAATPAFETWFTGARQQASERVSQRMGTESVGLAKLLALPLPAGQGASIEQNLKEWLLRADQYHPEQFRQAAKRYATQPEEKESR